MYKKLLVRQFVEIVSACVCINFRKLQTNIYTHIYEFIRQYVCYEHLHWFKRDTSAESDPLNV